MRNADTHWRIAIVILAGAFALLVFLAIGWLLAPLLGLAVYVNVWFVRDRLARHNWFRWVLWHRTRAAWVSGGVVLAAWAVLVTGLMSLSATNTTTARSVTSPSLAPSLAFVGLGTATPPPVTAILATPTLIPLTPTPIPPTPTVAPTETPDPTVFRAWFGPSVKMPTTMAGLPAYLESFLPPEAKGCVTIFSPTPTEHDVVCTFDMVDVPIGEPTIARKYARNFICAAYATGLPLNAVAIAIDQSDHRAGLAVGLGAKVAQTQPKNTWTGQEVGPTNFVRWLQSGVQVDDEFHPERDVYATGAWAN